MEDTQGGNVKTPKSNVPVKNVPKCSLLSVGIPGTKKTETFKAENINEFVKKIPQSYAISLRKTNGDLSKEKIEIKQFNDINLKTITSKSKVLNGQQTEKNFLYKFLEEWRKNPAFKRQFLEAIADQTRKQQLIEGLTKIRQAISQNEKPNTLMNFLKNL